MAGWPAQFHDGFCHHEFMDQYSVIPAVQAATVCNGLLRVVLSSIGISQCNALDRYEFCLFQCSISSDIQVLLGIGFGTHMVNCYGSSLFGRPYTVQKP